MERKQAIKTIERASVSESEWQQRVELAALYRMMARYGYTEGIFQHISLRLRDEPNHMLVNRFGVYFEEVTAGNLARVTLDGDTSRPEYEDLNLASVGIHTPIYNTRPDVNCIVHTHNEYVQAVGARPEGFIPLDQNGLAVATQLAYLEFTELGDVIDPKKLLGALGNKTILMMRNHGSLTAVDTVQKAFVYTRNLILVCKLQVLATSMGPDPQRVRREIEPEYYKELAKQLPRYFDLYWKAELRALDRIDPSYKH
ncbi:class II aldolase/adducin family protein [Pendulispora albinea]|uniref:Class II aldolase/adducin family protein n=1 Tax=Pendulispora albinea TaxID=2741071 RepID=A0ABZ2LRM2_9BACT